ncbi:MAG: exodeoxyribonuclease V subunit gamma [Lentisphaeria bacterium]|nr:exodeoxyribonuclease V subunit gamma [Lentisphaeria bacterium]
MGLKLYYNYKLELLAEQFAEIVYKQKSQDVSAKALLQGQYVVVQSRGMAEFLRQFLAENSRIAANLNMPFLNAFVNQILTVLYGNEFKTAALRSDPEYMQYLLMQIFCDRNHIEKDLPELAEYTSGDNAELKRWQLAGAVADVFDHYQLYRSGGQLDEMFEHNSGNHWQQILYNEIFNSNTPGRATFFQRFAAGDFDESKRRLLPPEVSVFGMGAMPPEYLNFFVNLSRYSKVNFFYLTPCMEYWENQKSCREVKKPAAWEIAESGNPLLQNLGRQGRSFFSCMVNHNEIANQMAPEFDGLADDYPANSTMLEIMQYDIRYLFDRRVPAPGEDDLFIGQVRSDLKNDHSVSIHNCHSLRRELEVLHDELLKIIKQGTDPSNIIVMAPDITACAPIIRAVFDNGELANVYSIADMPQAEQSMAWTAFKSILNTANSRFEYSNVMSLLDMKLIISVLNCSAEDLARFGKYIYDAGARWGYDKAMREKFCHSSFEEFSWQQAIDRLLAGFAIRAASGEETAITGNTKAMDALENPDIEAFARLVRVLEKLKDLSGNIAIAKDIPAWCAVFENIMESFFADTNDVRTAVAPLRLAVKKLRNAASKGFIPGIYPLNAALQILEDHVNNAGEPGRFLRGKITFCRMMPMRSIPMDTVAILELNSGSFPRNRTAPGFDLIPQLPHPGDRSLTAQDRYLLLEAIMAARKNLLFFYQGQNPRTGDDLPPCAPLAEIMEYLDNAFELKAYKHKVSGISEVYFTSDAPFASLNKENYRALKHLQERLQSNLQENPGSFPADDAATLASLYTPWQIQGNVTIKQLADFFANPCSWFLKTRFDFYADRQADGVPEDDELWDLSVLDRINVNTMLMNMRNIDVSDDEIYLHADKSNLLPPGRTGRQEFDALAANLAILPEFWQRSFKNMERLPVVYSSADKNYTVSGMVNMSCDQKYVLVFNWSSYKSKHALHALFGVLTAAASAAAEGRCVAIGAKLLNLDNSSHEFEFREIAPVNTFDAIRKLDELIALAGEKHAGPLPLFEKSSVYYHEPDIAGRKFGQGDFCDVKTRSVSYFFTPDMWYDKDFLHNFNYYAAKLYSPITLERDEKNNELYLPGGGEVKDGK